MIIDQQKFIRGLVDGEQISAAGQHGKVSQTAADVVLGHDLSRRRVDDRKAAAAAVGDEHGLAAIGRRRARPAGAFASRVGLASSGAPPSATA